MFYQVLGEKCRVMVIDKIFLKDFYVSMPCFLGKTFSNKCVSCLIV